MKKIILILALSFYCTSYSQIDFRKPGRVLTTLSYFVGAQDQCNDIWVGVFATENGQTLLISSGIVHVGEGCCNRIIPINSNPLCEDIKYKGDYIENSASKEFKYCLIEYLKDDDFYLKYQAEKYRILSEINK